MKEFNNCYKGKRILVTGHTGFKGSWLSIWLLELGAEVIGYALDPYTEKDNFVLSNLKDKMVDIRGDIRDRKKLHEVFETYKPEIIFHLAAQPLVKLSYSEPVETYNTNVMGTIYALEEIRACKESKIAIMVTTDKCYENNEHLWGYRETDAFGGYDPYSSSKGACEIAINSWRSSFFNPKEYEKHGKAIASVRAGNVIGGGDFSIDRIIPDCIKAIENNKPIEIRSPNSVRPWQHVLEALSGYLLLGQKLLENPVKYAEGWNFGPEIEEVYAVWDIASSLVEKMGQGKLVDVSHEEKAHEAKLLLLDITKAKIKLGWKPKFNIDETLTLVADWYKNYSNMDVYELCAKQIKKYLCYNK